MPANATEVSEYLKFALLQLGAESYLHGINVGNDEAVTRRFQFGFNDPSHDYIVKASDKTAEGEPDPATPSLPAYNRMIQTQASRLLDEWKVVDHHANDATGFSATLFKKNGANEYTLSFRSTEARTWKTAGDNQRDDKGANRERIFDQGFAFAQLAAMEDYWKHISQGEGWNGSSWVANANLDGLKASNRVLNVTGYSLGNNRVRHDYVNLNTN